MKLWMIAINIASSEELDEIDANAKKEVLEGKKAAWSAFIDPVVKEQKN
jgi:hypothetical protein